MIFFFSKKSLSRDDLTINSNSIIFNKFSIISIVSDFYLNFTFMLDKICITLRWLNYIFIIALKQI